MGTHVFMIPVPRLSHKLYLGNVSVLRLEKFPIAQYAMNIVCLYIDINVRGITSFLLNVSRLKIAWQQWLSQVCALIAHLGIPPVPRLFNKNSCKNNHWIPSQGAKHTLCNQFIHLQSAHGRSLYCDSCPPGQGVVPTISYGPSPGSVVTSFYIAFVTVVLAASLILLMRKQGYRGKVVTS